jgi:hypothetical protein
MSIGLKPVKEGTLEVSGHGPVRLRIVPIDHASATVEIGVDYSRAEVPQLHYDADYCDVIETRTGITIVFGKLIAGAQALRTKIEIAYSPQYFFRHLWKSTRALHESVRSMVQGSELSPLSHLSDPDKVQCLRSNNTFIAVMPGEAVLDFYFISPGDIHLARQTKKHDIHLSPVVRVAVSTPLLFEFLEKCKPLADALKSKLAEEEA